MLTATVLLIATVLSLGVFVSAETEYGAAVSVFNQNFNNVEQEDDFSQSLRKHAYGFSYCKGIMQNYKKAVRINSCDMRFEAGSKEVLNGVEIKLSFDEGYVDNVFEIGISNQGGSVAVLKVAPKDGAPMLYDSKGTEIMSLKEDGTVYHVYIENIFGESSCSVKINDEAVSGSFELNDPTYVFTGMSFLGTSEGKTSYLTADDIKFYTKGRVYPQKYSFDTKGDIPEINIPELIEKTAVDFWYNGVRYDCPVEIAVTDGTIYFPYDWIVSVMGDKSAEYSLNTETSVITRGGKSVTLKNPVKTEAEGKMSVPVQFIAEVYDAKMWLDEFHKMLIVTTGSRKDDDILRKNGSVLIMNGEPYYEISFNKFDLNYQIASDDSFNNGGYTDANYPSDMYTIEAAEEALKQLHENGFKSIRVFCNHINMNRNEAELERFWNITDTMYDLCEKYEIQVVASLTLFSAEFYPGDYVNGVWTHTTTENIYDTVTDPESASRKNLYDFLEAYVGRYKDRKCILMWEVQNEGNLQVDIGPTTGVIAISAAQQGDFYSGIADKIREVDPDRLVTTGDATLRPAQWHLYAGIKRGGGSDWTQDNWEERLKVLMLLNKGMDVISIHAYNGGYSDMYINEEGKGRFTNWNLFLEEAERLGMALYNGETAGGLTSKGAPAKEYGNQGKKTGEYRGYYLDKLIESGVQLTHWWTFHSDRATFGLDVDTFGVRVDDETKYTFEAVKKANEKIKATYLVNPIADENTDELGVYEAPAETETDEGTGTTEPAGGNTGLIIGIAATVVIVAGAAVVIVIKKKKK